MYLDDGVSRSSALPTEELPGSDEMGKGEYRAVQIRHTGYPNPNFDNKTRTISIERIHDHYTPFEKYFFVAILHDPSELPKRESSNKRSSSPLKSALVNEQEIPLITGDTPEKRANQLKNSPKNGWYYNENIDVSFIKVFDTTERFTLKLDYL